MDYSWKRSLLNFLFQKLRKRIFALSFGLAVSAFFSELKTLTFSALVYIKFYAFHMWWFFQKGSLSEKI